jgi:hypothetical protein
VICLCGVTIGAQDDDLEPALCADCQIDDACASAALSTAIDFVTAASTLP